MTTFEEAFEAAERAASAVVSSTTALLREARGMAKAAREGDISKMRRSSERLGTMSQAVRQEVANAQAAWPLSPDEEEKLLAEAFPEELIESGRRQGLAIRRQDESIVASPSLIRLLPGRRAVAIDKKAVTGIRPSRLVQLLKANAAKKPRSAPERFLEVLYSAYERLADADQASGVVTLYDAYKLLTLMPEWRKEYTPADFGRDLYFLDRSGTTLARSGARVSFPASTGTKGGARTFSFVAPDGEVHTYYAVRFTR